MQTQKVRTCKELPRNLSSLQNQEMAGERECTTEVLAHEAWGFQEQLVAEVSHTHLVIRLFSRTE